ncbi:unnamed protein product [Musa hybrid cultivar]
MWTCLSIPWMLSTPAWNSPSATCMTRCRTGKDQLTGRAKWYLSRCVIFHTPPPPPLGRAYPLSPGQQICGKVRDRRTWVGLWIEMTIVPCPCVEKTLARWCVVAQQPAFYLKWSSVA